MSAGGPAERDVELLDDGQVVEAMAMSMLLRAASRMFPEIEPDALRRWVSDIIVRFTGPAMHFRIIGSYVYVIMWT
jgi:hypothetical protein